MVFGVRSAVTVGVATTLAGIVVALGLWNVVLAERRAQLDGALIATANDAAAALEETLARQVRELGFVASDWAREQFVAVASDWPREQPVASPSLHRRAERLIGMREGLEAMRWVPAAETLPGAAADRAAAPGEIREPDLALRFRWLDGDPVSGEEAPRRYAELSLPGVVDDRVAGRLVARFDMDVLLDRILAARATRYALGLRAASDDGRPFYERGEPAPEDRRTRGWRHETNIETPFGAQWRLTALPTADFAAARLGPVPDYLLAVGVALSIVLGILVGVLGYAVTAYDRQRATNRRLVERERELTELTASLESRVAERTEELEDAVAELEAFNYSVSHDLRSPLGAILNFSSIIEEDHGKELGEDGLHLLARVKQSATRGIGLLEDLLGLSRAGRAAIEWEHVDLAGAARSAFAEAAAAEGGSDVDFHLDPLPTVPGDARLIGTVFENLFTNALKYSRERDQRRIEVHAERDGDAVVVTVVDNGCGFDMRYAPKLFKVFERLHRDSEIEGNGVGLAIVSRIIKRHGGRVWADAKPGVGARFSFSLPTTPRHEEKR